MERLSPKGFYQQVGATGNKSRHNGQKHFVPVVSRFRGGGGWLLRSAIQKGIRGDLHAFGIAQSQAVSAIQTNAAFLPAQIGV
jgi:hypothetical protein